MAMPHPQVTMVPFGCVICQTVYLHSARVDIYRDKSAIEGAHVAFTRIVYPPTTTVADVICATTDDGSVGLSPDKCSVLDNTGRKVVGAYSAWRILANNSSSEKFKPVAPTSVAEPRMVIEAGYYYFLLPSGVTPPAKKKKPAKKKPKKKPAKKKPEKKRSKKKGTKKK